jgi:peptidyl-tRNA hydrolase, PTH1 family
MYCIIGLGNFGNDYTLTRHNVGFLVVDEFAARAHTAFYPGKGEYWQAKCSLNDTEVALLKPVTFMNNSGIAVHEFLEKQEIPIDHILVVCDDFQLSLGTIRLRKNGTDGGHHGLSSVIYHLQTDQFARLRCGIGSAVMPLEKGKMKDFVLEQFSESELPNVKLMVERAHNACISYITNGIDRTMNRFNTQFIEESS